MASGLGRGDIRRKQIVEAAADVLLTSGVSELSLRTIAARIGTSHRMLLYHFKSKEELLVAAFNESRNRQQEMISDILERHPDASLPEQIQRLWDWLTLAETQAAQRLFFEVYGRALRDPELFPGFLDRVVADWLSGNEQLYRSLGFPEDVARSKATLLVATIRGLMLDYLGSPDRGRVDEALQLYLKELKSGLAESPRSRSGA